MTKTNEHKIGDRLGFYGPDGQYRTYRQIHAKAPVPISRRIQHAWKAVNKPREFIFTPGKGLRAVLLLSLLAFGVLLSVDQVLRFQPVEAAHGVDRQTIWSENLGSASLQGWNSRNALYETGVGARAVIRLTSSTTEIAVAINKEPMDFSTLAAKTLEAPLIFTWFNTTGCCGFNWGWFLTRNQTLPTSLTYNPYADPNVVLFYKMTPLPAATERTDLFIQRTLDGSIGDGDFGSCETGSTCYLSGSGIVTLDTTTAHNLQIQTMNFTGNQNFNSVISHGSSGATTGTNLLPWLQLQGGNYYLGLWQDVTTGNRIGMRHYSYSVASNNGMAFNRLTPALASPELEPSGFFGPLIRFLMSLLYWGLLFLSSFFGAVANAFVTALDSVGSFFGLGNIGTALRDALVGVGTWVSSVFGTIFGQSISIATAISNALSALVQVTGTYWTQLTSWLSAVSNLLSLIWPFVAFFGVGLPFSAFLMIWMMYGALESYSKRDGFLRWARWTWLFSATIFNFSWKIAEMAIDVIIKVKKLLHPTAA